MNEREVFDAALAIADPNERSSYLDRACAGNQPLRDHFRGLLEAHDKLGGFLQRPLPVGDMTAASCVAAKVGTVIAGRYKLLEQIGEGGMGAVWVAEQTEPVKRRVALKLIKPGMDTRQVLSRFEAERQALALMDHPNIAKVFDGGMTDEGRPYFVMEYVKGLPITEYCDDARLTVADRLALFAQVCQAVQHAHQKGIIHRDLKPSNILVCLYDGQPVPKVIDFGLAKAMHQSLTEHTLYTAHGLMVGTPLYMSPEQAEFNNLDIDTRSDIYSLGVVLYELLTGTTPLEKRQFKDAAWHEMVRLIKEEEPPRPSTRLSGSGSLPTLAAQRQLEPAKLAKAMRGELDWIVMKALEKDRSRRYESANGLARDVQRFLADESVEACPPSAGYRLRKFARRNQRALTTTALLAALLLVAFGAVAVSIGWAVRDHEARRTKLAGQLDLILDEVQQHEAKQKWPEALAAARRAEALLAGGGGDAALSRQVMEALADLNLIERLEEIRLEQARVDSNRPQWADRAYTAAFREIGFEPDTMSADEAAKSLLARKQVAPALAVALDEWAIWRYMLGEFAGARVIATVARRLDEDPWRQQLRGVLAAIDEQDLKGAYQRTNNLDARTVAAFQALAASPLLAAQPPALPVHLAMALSQGAGKHELGTELLRKVYRQHPSDFWVNAALADILMKMGPDHQDEALGYYRATLALRPDVGFSWYRIGSIYQLHHQNLEEANACYRQALLLDTNDPWMHNYIGSNYRSQKKLDEAAACFRRTIELNPNIAFAQSNLGTVLREQNKLDEAILSFQKAIELNPKVSSWRTQVAYCLLDLNRSDEAVAYLQRAIDGDPKSANFRFSLGDLLRRQKKFDEASAAYAKGVELDPKNSYGYFGLGVCLLDNNAVLQKAEKEKCVAHFRKGIEVDPKNVNCHWGLGRALWRLKRWDESITCFHKSLELNPTHANSHWGLAYVFLDQNLPDQAVAAFRKAIAIDPNHAYSQTGFGLALLAHNQPGEAKAAFTRAIELDPKRADAYFQLGILLRDERKFDEALISFRRTIELNPKNDAAQVHIDAILKIQGKTQPATTAPEA
jgi:tetratricopeptide (TPR) repeat protein/tRNA A-37 threonylcarbamoyl transferase component Bud32